MKRLLAVILLLIYAGANLGLTVRFDYCRDSLDSVAIFAEEDAVGDCCDHPDENDDCCSSQLAFFQEDSDKLSTSQQWVLYCEPPDQAGGLNLPHAFGHLPLLSGDFTKPIHHGPGRHILHACFLI